MSTWNTSLFLYLVSLMERSRGVSFTFLCKRVLVDFGLCICGTCRFHQATSKNVRLSFHMAGQYMPEMPFVLFDTLVLALVCWALDQHLFQCPPSRLIRNQMKLLSPRLTSPPLVKVRLSFLNAKYLLVKYMFKSNLINKKLCDCFYAHLWNHFCWSTVMLQVSMV